MTERERLVELLKKADDFTYSIENELADYLLDNGVIVLPCEVGDTVWSIVPIWMTKDKIQSKTYNTLFEIFEDWYIGSFGKYIFLTREEAEKALSEKGD